MNVHKYATWVSYRKKFKERIKPTRRKKNKWTHVYYTTHNIITCHVELAARPRPAILIPVCRVSCRVYTHKTKNEKDRRAPTWKRRTDEHTAHSFEILFLVAARGRGRVASPRINIRIRLNRNNTHDTTNKHTKRHRTSSSNLGIHATCVIGGRLPYFFFSLSLSLDLRSGSGNMWGQIADARRTSSVIRASAVLLARFMHMLDILIRERVVVIVRLTDGSNVLKRPGALGKKCYSMSIRG